MSAMPRIENNFDLGGGNFIPTGEEQLFYIEAQDLAMTIGFFTNQNSNALTIGFANNAPSITMNLEAGQHVRFTQRGIGFTVNDISSEGISINASLFPPAEL